MSTLTAPQTNLVQAAIRSAWRRRLLVLSVEELGFALSIMLPGAVVMLLLGTQILDWYWLVLLAFAASSTAGVRVRRRVVNHYAVAQILDERLQFRDSLSTAWFLLTDEGKRDSGVASFQMSMAERLARGVDAGKVFGFEGRRVWAVAGGMACVVAGLFAVRYLVTDSLSLRTSLVPLHFSELSERVAEVVSPKARGFREQPREPQNAAEEARNQNAKHSDEAQSSRDLAGQEQNADGRDAGSDAGAREGGQPEQFSGVMDKMRDALSSLMTKFQGKTAAAEKSGQRPGQYSRDGLAEDNRGGQNAQAAPTKDGAEQTRDGQQQQAESGARAKEQEETTEAGSRTGMDSEQGPQGKNSESQSGAGRQDGDKTLSEAEQLKAMGHIAEIIGKRAANVSGEMTVEKSSGRQELQTQYSNQQGRHQDLGGEINHDEIPPEYRDYVREYMNEVHQQAEAKH